MNSIRGCFLGQFIFSVLLFCLFLLRFILLVLRGRRTDAPLCKWPRNCMVFFTSISQELCILVKILHYQKKTKIGYHYYISYYVVRMCYKIYHWGHCFLPLYPKILHYSRNQSISMEREICLYPPACVLSPFKRGGSRCLFT